MPIAFNADEIFEIAQQIEINGANFYNKAAQHVSQASVQLKLRELAAMEERHQRVFARLREQLSDVDHPAAVFDPNGEAAQYLRSMADERVFNLDDPSRRLNGHETLHEVLLIAISLEKDSIAFYVGMLDLVPEDLGRFKIAEIIKEEMRHVVILTDEMARVPAAAR